MNGVLHEIRSILLMVYWIGPTRPIEKVIVQRYCETVGRVCRVCHMTAELSVDHMHAQNKQLC